ncbi:MAG: EAL domain-containing protein [Pseudomonadota bacterium]
MVAQKKGILSTVTKWDALLGQRVLDTISFVVPTFLFSAFAIAPKAVDLQNHAIQFLVLAFILLASFARLVTGWSVLRSLRFQALSAALDIGGLYVFLFAIAAAYGEPLAMVLKAPTTNLLFVYIIARVVLFDIRLIAFTGGFAALGWAGLTYCALFEPGSPGTTRQFTEYMTSMEILVGAQVEQIISILLVTLVSAAVINAYQKDGLTGLRKRREFLRALQRRFAKQTGSEHSALILVRIASWEDLARTQKSAADKALQSVASALMKAPVPTYMAARYEAGAIMLWKRGADSEAALKNHLKLLMAIATEALAPQRLPVHIGAVQTDEYSRKIIRDVLVAVEHAAERLDQIQICDAALSALIDEQDQITAQLETAVEDDKVVVLHQPIVDMLSNRIAGTEALTRLRGEDDRLISPIAFVPIAEKSGKIDEIGAQILAIACRDNEIMRQAGLGEDLFISVNVAPPQVQAWTRLRGAVKTAIDQSIPLKLEVTESIAAQDDTMLDRISILKEFGAKLAIDDFGTGYSSLERLADMPFDTIKIDMAFTRKITQDDGFAMIDAIVRMARASGKDIIIEGIETAEQQALALKAGIRLGQGYYFSRPVSVEDLLQQAQAGPDFLIEDAADVA